MHSEPSQVRNSAPVHALGYTSIPKARRLPWRHFVVRCSHCLHYIFMGFHAFYERLRGGTLYAFFEAMAGECRGPR
jgi:hypothetical protein